MAFLWSNPDKESANASTPTIDATKKDDLSLKTSSADKDVKTTNDTNHSGSMWSVFQDRLLRRDEPMKDESKRVDSKATTSGANLSNNSSNDDDDDDKTAKDDEDNIVLLSKDALRELELQEKYLPDRWLDYFCIVGMDPDATLLTEEEEKSGIVTGDIDDKPPNKPTLLDRYPKDDRPDMEFPQHLPTFCFPNGGCRPLKYKIRREDRQSASNSKKSSKTNSKKEAAINPIKYHHNAPDPYLCSMVLTSGSGHRLYCTALTVYETREDKKKVPEKKTEESKPEDEDIAEETPPPELNTNWWEEPDTEDEAIIKPTKKVTAASSNTIEVEYYWMVPKCLVFMSHYPFFQAQSTALQELFYTVQSGVSPIPFERYVAHLVEDLPLPRSGVGTQQPKSPNHTVVEWMSWIKPVRTNSFKVPTTIRLERPPPNRLPLLNVSMEPLLRTLSLSNILVLWANLLQEGKVVLACSNNETAALLTPIAEALLALLFPLRWQGIYVPVLPNHHSVLDVLEAPVPYLIGLVTRSSEGQPFDPQSHPSGVLWCDLDNDTLHLGFKGDQIFYNRTDSNGEEIPLLPALPSEASMALKAELEEIADPLYLPTMEGIKGRMTVGDRTIELDNALRQPYAQRTKLFANPIATPRKYILTQSSKIPPRGKALKYEDFSIVHSKTHKPKPGTPGTKSDEDEVEICGLSLEAIQIPCGEEPDSVDVVSVGREEEEQNPEEEPKTNATSQDSKLLLSLKRQGRSVQAQVDRAMAVLGQNYATPSQYAAQSNQQFANDVLNRQDAIAADFFSVDQQEKRTITEKVRESFLRFILVTFSRYRVFVDSETNQLDEDRFVASLNLSHRQREYVRDVVTSQMFETFLHDTRSLKNRKLFDEYIIKYKKGIFHIDGDTELDRCYGTPLLDSSQWGNPTIIFPEQPCRVGLKEGRIYCCDRRFPDNLDPDECITNQSVSYWKAFWDGAFCSAFSNCI